MRSWNGLMDWSNLAKHIWWTLARFVLFQKHIRKRLKTRTIWLTPWTHRYAAYTRSLTRKTTKSKNYVIELKIKQWLSYIFDSKVKYIARKSLQRTSTLTNSVKQSTPNMQRQYQDRQAHNSCTIVGRHHDYLTTRRLTKILDRPTQHHNQRQHHHRRQHLVCTNVPYLIQELHPHRKHNHKHQASARQEQLFSNASQRRRHCCPLWMGGLAWRAALLSHQHRYYLLHHKQRLWMCLVPCGCCHLIRLLITMTSSKPTGEWHCSITQIRTNQTMQRWSSKRWLKLVAYWSGTHCQSEW